MVLQLQARSTRSERRVEDRRENKRVKKNVDKPEKMCHLCLNFHNKTTIHTIEQVSTGDGHIELNHVRITPEEGENDKAQTKGKDNSIRNAVTQQ